MAYSTGHEIPTTITDVIIDLVPAPLDHRLGINLEWFALDEPSYCIEKLPVRKDQDVLRRVRGDRGKIVRGQQTSETTQHLFRQCRRDLRLPSTVRPMPSVALRWCSRT